MTRKDYVIIAQAIRAARQDVLSKEGPNPDDLLDGIGYAAEHIADALEKDNPAFRREMFLAASGVLPP
jgi:hypothetical protein